MPKYNVTAKNSRGDVLMFVVSGDNKNKAKPKALEKLKKYPNYDSSKLDMLEIENVDKY